MPGSGNGICRRMEMKNRTYFYLGGGYVPKLSTMELVACGLIGAFTFLCVFGVIPLIVNDDRWILNGYIEKDVIQHYAGWMAFRKSAWQYPLGAFTGLMGGIVSYTDSIPWIAIFFKLFESVLPETFQYFGIYIFVCYILQGITGGMIFKLFSDHRILHFQDI